MPVAFLPSPARSLWQLGPIPVRAAALCVVAGVVLGLWLTGRRYRALGGSASVIWDIATVAVPAGLVAARAYSVLTDLPLYFGDGRDWASVLRIWGGSLGLPGAVAGGGLAAWLYCRRNGIRIAPVAGAAAPALAFAQAIGCWAFWFGQNLYGRPSGLPWAVEISPVHRLSGYESYATFQPIFGYESLWAIVMGVLLIQAARRLALTGDRLFACYAALYAAGRLVTDFLRLGRSVHLLGLRVSQLIMIGVLAAAVAYLRMTRERRGPDIVERPPARRPPAAETVAVDASASGTAASGTAAAGTFRAETAAAGRSASWIAATGTTASGAAGAGSSAQEPDPPRPGSSAREHKPGSGPGGQASRQAG
ncbi:MAG: prolipoprotein diacylglyceryl transferase family protein [Streptosporangiaceae bacterium]